MGRCGKEASKEQGGFSSSKISKLNESDDEDGMPLPAQTTIDAEESAGQPNDRLLGKADKNDRCEESVPDESNKSEWMWGDGESPYKGVAMSSLSITLRKEKKEVNIPMDIDHPENKESRKDNALESDSSLDQGNVETVTTAEDVNRNGKGE